MTPLQRACWTLVMTPLVAVAASIVTVDMLLVFATARAALAKAKEAK